jgi:hypothetical protein
LLSHFPAILPKSPDVVDIMFQGACENPISKEAYMRQLNATIKFNAYDRLQQIRVSILILQGRKKVVIPPENGSILAEAILNAKLIYFEKSAHYLAEEIRKVKSASDRFPCTTFSIQHNRSPDDKGGHSSFTAYCSATHNCGTGRRHSANSRLCSQWNILGYTGTCYFPWQKEYCSNGE